MIPAISQVCSLNSSFEDDVDQYAAGQCQAIEVWLTKLETFLQSHSVDDFQRLRDEHGVTFPVASFQGGILASQGEARRVAWDQFRTRLELCQQLEIGTIVVAMDVARPISQTDVERAQLSLVEATQEAARRGVRIALEFQAGSAFGNNLQTAAALVEEVGSPSLGLCLDVVHFYTGPSKTEDLGYLTAQNLFHVQLADLADTPREFVADSLRIVPGDGDIPLQPLIDRLHAINYAGHVSLELMNPQIWQIPALQIGEIGMTALRKLLGQASMGS
ncbi:MAG: sugar phosphate isomerase/epimerase [Planctomycetales bacterium]|nr:sugar phosphate isomerase/epimerase [Planctomycetales bacterium]